MKINSNIAFNKVNDDEIKVLKLDDDNNVYTLEKYVAHVFEMVSNGDEVPAIKKKISAQLSSKSEKEIDAFLASTIEEFQKLGFFE
tara:strand:- start:10694 stop:10951 length:258 start_codon:yes stop_codon:yes gene_type:complete